MSELPRFGVCLEKKLLNKFDRLIAEERYRSRSEAFRDMVREKLVKKQWNEGKEVAGAITLIYDHHKRELQERLTKHQHEHHEAVISMMHVHLDHYNCLEVMAVRGKAKAIRKIADDLISTKGVKHGKLVMTSTGENL